MKHVFTVIPDAGCDNLYRFSALAEVGFSNLGINSYIPQKFSLSKKLPLVSL